MAGSRRPRPVQSWPQALRSLSLCVTQIAAKGRIRLMTIDSVSKAPSWL